MGVLESVTIGHDAKNLGSDWALQRVQVVNTATGVACTFVHDGWIPTKAAAENPVTLLAQGVAEPSGSPDSEWAPADADAAQASVGDVLYRLRVVTSNKLGAGTDATVHVEFSDALGARCGFCRARVHASPRSSTLASRHYGVTAQRLS